MKTRMHLIAALAVLAFGNAAYSATITWTNTAGGNWSAAANWNPNQVPGAGDTAVITGAGSYTVTLDTSPVINSLTLGGISGQQTLLTGGQNLTLNSASVVNTNGVLGLGGGILTGSALTVKGQLNWTAGQIGAGSVLTVATNGVLTVAGNTTYLEFSGVLTNAGTIQLVSSGLRCVDYNGYGGGIGKLVNLPGGLVDVQSDVSIYFYTDGSGSATPPGVINQGTLRKSGGSGVSYLSDQTGYSSFYNSGTLDAQTGTISMNTTGNGNGTFKAEAGANLAFAVNYEVDSALTGAGTNLFNGGTFTLNGTLATSNAMLNAGILTGTNGVIKDALTWTAGQIGAGSVLTVATNGVLTVAGNTAYLEFSGVLTNAGTIQLVSSGLRCIDYSTYGGGIGKLVNLPGGLVDVQSDVSIYFYTDGSGSATPPGVINQGTVRKSGGSGISYLSDQTGYSSFYNSGTLDAQTGTISMNTTGNGNGTFKAEAGANLAFAVNYEVDSALTGAGTNLFNGGTFTLNGTLATSNAMLNAGILTGTNGVIKDALTWTAGQIGAGSTLTVATNGVLTVAGSGYLDMLGILTNAGTMQLVSGTFRCLAYVPYGGGIGELVNLPGALVDVQADVTIDYYTDGSAAPSIVNKGTVRKSGGTAITYINPPLYNTGTVDGQSGTISVSGGGVNSGTFFAEAGATVAIPQNYELEGVLTGPGNLLNGGVLSGTNGIIKGVLTWTAGRFATNSTLTVATNGVLTVAGSGYLDMLGILTNAGTMQLVSGTFRCLAYVPYGGGIGELVNLPGALVDVQADVTIDYYTDGSAAPSIVNKGTVRKSGGTAITYINPPFYNTGTLDAQTGIINLTANSYSLTGGRLNFGLNSLTNYGQISLGGSPAALDGTLSVNFNNGYSPVRSNSFNVISYASQTGTFTNFILPNTIAWQTNYNPTAFNLTVLNSSPFLPAQTNRTVNELTTLTVTNTATDFDLPPDTLTYSFLAAPGTASISPAGIITWTPAETDGPGTNIFTTRVVDNGTPSLSATNTFTVFVNEINVAPVLPASFQTNVNELATLTITNTATDSDIPINPLTYTLLSAPANVVISTNGVITWTPSQLQSPGTNIITTVVTDTNVFAVNSKSLSATNSITVVVKEVNVPASLPAISTQTVNELTLLTFPNIATNFNIHSTNSGYGLVSPPAGMSVSAGGVITWTPSQTQSPSTNLITTVVTNSNPYDLVHPNLTSTNQFTVVVKEINVAPTPPTVSTQIVNELTLLTVTNAATNSNIHSTIAGYTLVSPPSGMVIGTNGIITWTPAQAQSPSTNLITTIVTNSNPYDLVNPNLTSTNSFTVIVREVNVAPTLPVVPVQTVNAQSSLTVTNTAAESNIHATLGYALLSAPAGMGISANGIITWTPTRLQGPSTNVITTVVTNTDSFDPVNPHLSATNSFTVIVYAPTLAVIGNYTLNAGQTVAFTASATDNDPTRTLTYSLVSPPGGAVINGASGVFNWRVPVSFASTTTNLQVNVTDNSTPTLSDTKSFTVTVNPLASVVLTPLGYTNGQFKLQVSGTTGPDYIISASGTLTSWTDLATNLSPTPPFQFTDTNAPSTTNRFYRARMSP